MKKKYVCLCVNCNNEAVYKVMDEQGLGSLVCREHVFDIIEALMKSPDTKTVRVKRLEDEE